MHWFGTLPLRWFVIRIVYSNDCADKNNKARLIDARRQMLQYKKTNTKRIRKDYNGPWRNEGSFVLVSFATPKKIYNRC